MFHTSHTQPVEGADFIIPVKIEDTVHKVYVLKRPGVDEFMKQMGELYEIVIFTASLSLVSQPAGSFSPLRVCVSQTKELLCRLSLHLQYADPLLDKLDIHNTIRHRLFRESCTYYQVQSPPYKQKTLDISNASLTYASTFENTYRVTMSRT